MGSTVIINGVTISGGRNVTIINNKVIVDGKDVTPDSKTINIVVNGNVEQLQVDNCEKVSVTGSAGTVRTTNGSIEVGGDVQGNVTTTNGSVSCQNVSGDITSTNGAISARR
jgi:hypothetical protein